MADLIDFPTLPNDPDALPEPGDAYQAFSPPTPHPYLSLALLFPDGSIYGYQLRNLEQYDFAPSQKPSGSDVLNLYFAGSSLTEIRIEGRNLFELCYYLGEQRIRWLRLLADGQDIKDPNAPVITRIVFTPPKKDRGR
jgi:hypothetical protein